MRIDCRLIYNQDASVTDYKIITATRRIVSTSYCTLVDRSRHVESIKIKYCSQLQAA